MKKLVLVVVVLCLAVPALANLSQSLGSWNEGAVGSTHQLWHFTPGYVTAISGNGYSATPEQVSNPVPSSVVASILPGGSWDNVTQFISTGGISVSLEIPNYENLNKYKEIWVDIGTAVATNFAVSAFDGGSITFTSRVLSGQGDAEFGFRIWPNPYTEIVTFWVTSATGAPAVLDYIHVDTICIPEPATIALLGLGVLTLLRKRRA
ncbi:MAG: PEP-CTERM sorting domain-containing protein [Planctomycetota bacterium]|nr:PEP-CTERM sorting domain-containing protein [Planctomycetota bacterium]